MFAIRRGFRLGDGHSSAAVGDDQVQIPLRLSEKDIDIDRAGRGRRDPEPVALASIVDGQILECLSRRAQVVGTAERTIAASALECIRGKLRTTDHQVVIGVRCTVAAEDLDIERLARDDLAHDAFAVVLRVGRS